MYEQRLDIMLKLESTKAKMLRREARKAEIEEILNDPNASHSAKLNAQADMIEWKSGEGLLELALAGAEQEIATIENIMEELEPNRKYGHLPVLEASQADNGKGMAIGI
jgi:hypothetical protein